VTPTSRWLWAGLASAPLVFSSGISRADCSDLETVTCGGTAAATSFVPRRGRVVASQSSVLGSRFIYVELYWTADTELAWFQQYRYSSLEPDVLFEAKSPYINDDLLDTESDPLEPFISSDSSARFPCEYIDTTVFDNPKVNFTVGSACASGFKAKTKYWTFARAKASPYASGHFGIRMQRGRWVEWSPDICSMQTGWFPWETEPNPITYAACVFSCCEGENNVFAVQQNDGMAPGCYRFAWGNGSYTSARCAESDCGNDADDDWDGLKDCADADCARDPFCAPSGGTGGPSGGSGTDAGTTVPILTVSPLSPTVSGTVTFKCALGDAGSGHTVAFFVTRGSTIASKVQLIANTSGTATWQAVAGAGWLASPTVGQDLTARCRDESVTPATDSSWVRFCLAATCPSASIQCGGLETGCGNTLQCGNCASKPAECVNGGTMLRTYSSASCTWGTCGDLTTTDTPCANGCASGKCCLATCPVGVTQCTGTQVQTCADANGDGCFEWGPPAACPGTAICVGDRCEGPPVAPALLAPAEGATVMPGPVTFSWAASPNANRYHFMLCADPALSRQCVNPDGNNMVGAEPDAGQTSEILNLQTGDMYWAVRAIATNETLGWGLYSPARALHVAYGGSGGAGGSGGSGGTGGSGGLGGGGNGGSIGACNSSPHSSGDPCYGFESISCMCTMPSCNGPGSQYCDPNTHTWGACNVPSYEGMCGNGLDDNCNGFTDCSDPDCLTRPECSGGSGGAGGSAGATGCVPESDTAFCTRLGKSCGSVSGADNCGNGRVVTSCGTCTAPNICGANNVCGCVAESDGTFCARLGKNCGSVTTADNCGTGRTVASCGTCNAPQTCGPVTANVCGTSACTAETDGTFCTRLGKDCGSVIGTDNCGQPRSVGSCGTCTLPQSCDGGGAVNVCGCASETDAAFCSRLGKNCGGVNGADNCGTTRTVNSCGTCTSLNTCGGGAAPSVCGCTAENDATFCTRLGKNCGAVTANDNCGASRTVAPCGTCASPQTCDASNVCACAAERDTAFCSRLGKSCGSVTAPDNCGTSRTVGSCGTCTAPQTCGSGTANVCGCAAETDATFCSRLGKDCGLVSAADNCGNTRTGIDCGTCTGVNTCSGSGTPNVCGCMPESNVAFCARLAKTCGPVTANDNCGTTRTVTSCGTCTAPKTCSASNVCESCVANCNGKCGGATDGCGGVCPDPGTVACSSCYAPIVAHQYRTCVDKLGRLFYDTSQFGWTWNGAALSDADIAQANWYAYTWFDFASGPYWRALVLKPTGAGGSAYADLPTDLLPGLCPQVQGSRRHPYRVSSPYRTYCVETNFGCAFPGTDLAAGGSDLIAKSQAGLVASLPDGAVPPKYGVFIAVQHDALGVWSPAAQAAQDKMGVPGSECVP